MNVRDMLTYYALKWDPFCNNVPIEGLVSTTMIDQFCWRIENLVIDGGFALISGDSGTRKSVTIKLLAHRLEKIRDIKVGMLQRPQSGVADFYRELGDLFGLTYKVSNRYSCYKGLRHTWQEYIKSSLFRPILLIDEAQEMPVAVLNELRLLSSCGFDAQVILATVFCGDKRFSQKLNCEELRPLEGRIKMKCFHENASKDEIENVLVKSLALAGNAKLFNESVIKAVAEHSLGNYRTMASIGSDILLEAFRQEKPKVDEQIFFARFGQQKKKKSV